MFGLGMGEIIVIGLIALIVIGPKKLPEVAKGLGKGIRDFQNAAKGLSDEVQENVSLKEEKPAIQATPSIPDEQETIEAPYYADESDIPQQSEDLITESRERIAGAPKKGRNDT